MWVLLLIFLASPGHPEQQYELISQQTQDDCERLRRFVLEDMAKWYPGEHDYRVVCEIKI